VAENEKKVKAPAKAKKNAAESAGTEAKPPKAKPLVEAKTVAKESKPRAKTAKTKEVIESAATAASNGPQRVPSKTKSAPGRTKETGPAPTHQEIAQLAHRFWKERGGHHGSHEHDWLRAERELRGMAS